MAKILVVDDALIMRKGISKIINKLGHEVIGEGKSGEEAILKYKQLQPDVVMLDITMEGIDGIETCKIIVDEFSNAKIVMCSSHTNEETKKQAFSAGAIGYITKPFNETDIAIAITSALK